MIVADHRPYDLVKYANQLLNEKAKKLSLAFVPENTQFFSAKEDDEITCLLPIFISIEEMESQSLEHGKEYGSSYTEEGGDIQQI